MPTSPPLPAVSLADIGFVGSGLARPECVLATARGSLFVSDRRGGVCCIEPDGRQHLIGVGASILPNGIALRQDGSFLVANLNSEGGVWQIDSEGRTRPFLLEVNGAPLPAVNFVRLDADGRVWICANPPLTHDGRYRTEQKEGYVVVVDKAGARIAADSIGWANECLVHPSGRHLYVNETFARRLTRFDIGENARLSNRTTYAQFGPGTYPDGIALDEEDGIWVVGVTANRLIRVTPDGRQQVILEDSDSAQMDALEQAYAGHRLTRTNLVKAGDTMLKGITSIAFGGPDRRTAFLGSLADNRLATFRSPVAGHAPVHWDW